MSEYNDIALLNELNKINGRTVIYMNNPITIKLAIASAYLDIAIKYISEAIQQKYKEDIVCLEKILSDLD